MDLYKNINITYFKHSNTYIYIALYSHQYPHQHQHRNSCSNNGSNNNNRNSKRLGMEGAELDTIIYSDGQQWNTIFCCKKKWKDGRKIFTTPMLPLDQSGDVLSKEFDADIWQSHLIQGEGGMAGGKLQRYCGQPQESKGSTASVLPFVGSTLTPRESQPEPKRSRTSLQHLRELLEQVPSKHAQRTRTG